MGKNWHAVIQRAWCCSLQTCSDRLHMPGNLEFISPPFLISAPVIQINSNEISRGKALSGGGSADPHSPVQSYGLFPGLMLNNPPPHRFQHVEEQIWSAVTHRHWVSVQKEPELLSWLWGIVHESISFHPVLARSVGSPQIRWRASWTIGQNSRGFYSQYLSTWSIGVLSSKWLLVGGFIWSNRWPK